jgi:serine protease Do
MTPDATRSTRRALAAALLAVSAGVFTACQIGSADGSTAVADDPSATPAEGSAPPASATLVQEPPTQAPAEMREAAAQVDASRRTAIVRASERVAPAVVTINSVRTQRVRPSSMWESFFLPPNAARRVSGLGSGFVIDGGRGLIVTNDHVVQGAERLLATFPDGRAFEAEVVGTDPVTDVAVIRVDSDERLPEAPLGTSDSLYIGEWVVAIGNPFGYLLSNPEPTVTAGVVSAVGRHIVPTQEDQRFYLGMIQTDASINPGNSGGPLVNALGQVIGVNSSIFSRSGGSEGLGFAIPIDRALHVAGDLIDFGEVRRAWMGIDVEPAEADDWGRTRGILVSQVAGDSPAAEAGLVAGGRILAANGRRLAAPLDWEDVKLDLRPGDMLAVEIEGRAEPLRVRADDLPSLRAERVEVLGALEMITVTPQIRAERGLASEDGALVVSASAAASSRIGLRDGDVLVQINNVRVRSAEEAARLFEQLPTGRVRLGVERRGGYVFLDFVWRTG